MPDYTVTEAEPRPYLYVEGSCGTDPSEISAAMGEAVGAVMAAMQRDGIAPAGPPLAVYHDYDPAQMRFRAGVFVSESDAARTVAGVKADRTPGGKALHFVHVGPYATLRDDYDEMMRWIDSRGLTLSAPTWEVYVDDPAAVPEAELRTEVWSALG
ncbi:MAG: GyrI-like domain-containing protein [Rhodosalinus sp.]